LNALRFIIEGDGTAGTTVDGIPCPMVAGDFVLTPGWCWHEHSHEGNKRAVWLDALDAQLQRHLCTNELSLDHQTICHHHGPKTPIRVLA
jgi:gentisate 1,2-dioxygenase